MIVMAGSYRRYGVPARADKSAGKVLAGVPLAACPPVIACDRRALAGKLPVAPRESAGKVCAASHTAGTTRYNRYFSSRHLDGTKSHHLHNGPAWRRTLMNLALRLANVLTFAGQLPPVVADSIVVGGQDSPLSIKSGRPPAYNRGSRTNEGEIPVNGKLT